MSRERPSSDLQPVTEVQPQRNRKGRRHPKSFGKSPIVAEYLMMEKLMKGTTDEWREAFASREQDPTRIIFQGKPFIYQWLKVRRKIPDFLERAQPVNLTTPFVPIEGLNRFDGQDYFSGKLGRKRIFVFPVTEGISFGDIEQMPLIQQADIPSLQLDREDIKRINSIYYGSNRDQFHQVARDAILFFVTQRLVREGESLRVPTELRPLRERLSAYFDYYTDLLLNPDLPPLDEVRFGDILKNWTPYLLPSLGCYIPARLGITPSSAIKLFQTRAELSLSPFFWNNSGILNTLEASAKNAYTENNLPADLKQYQHYNSQIDREAANSLRTYYRSLKLNNEDLVQAYDKQQELVDKATDLYFSDLLSDIRHVPKRCLEIDVSDHPLFDRVIVASQNSRNLIFIIHFQDGQTYLTLELSQDQKLYGLPAKTIKENRHFMDFILSDILSPVLEYARLKHPGREPIRISDYQKKKRVEAVERGDEETRSIKVMPQPKRFRTLTPIAKILEGPEPVNPSTPEKQKFVVIYSREQIAEGMPRNTSEEVIEQITRLIRGFELGKIDIANKIEEAGEDIYELKGRKYRILIRHEHGNIYSFLRAGNRGDNQRIFITR